MRGSVVNFEMCIRDRPDGVHPLAQAGEILLPFLVAALGQQLLGGIIALRVDGGAVQKVVTLRHPQEAGALLIGFFAQFGDFEKLFAGGEGAVFFPIGDDRCV